MKLDAIFQLFVPKEPKFFVLFEKASTNLVLVAESLVKMLKEPNEEARLVIIREIEKLEHQGDIITHEIFHELSTTFITPFDREDIHALASAIDDIVDYVHGSGKRIELYNIKSIPPSMQELGNLILEGSKELQKAVLGLRNADRFKKVQENCVKINSIENAADDVFDRAVGRLFDMEKDAINLLREKEVLQNLETATDKCEDAANVIESIIVKYS
jgi:predicted phosphate transport protein (TIGR00153 family)